ncbi:hypothetical protein M902_1190 [Bacteriovorax sp. BAL6_X]|uniref:hypothetical protein n=1 Tax=Bacteriovorax sp. BAL6_X TaxID=1201290 RepID=UPI0003866455|nr:hypothetical protein [Bacteriovorax sp. BAL6_X]EPZ49955.1 hypothetical protein M902_1190 [Bacteriovorax sp. BAL6_X]
MSAEKKQQEDLLAESEKIQNAVDEVLGSDTETISDAQEKTSLTLVDTNIDFSQLNNEASSPLDEGIELNFDDVSAIDLCAEGDIVENAPANSDSPNDLDMDFSSSIKINLTQEGDTIPNASIDAAREDDLDLDNNPIIVEDKVADTPEAQVEEVEELEEDISEDDIEMSLGEMDNADDLNDLDNLDDELSEIEMSLGDDLDDELDDDLGDLSDLDSLGELDDLGDFEDVDADLDSDLDMSFDTFEQDDITDEVESLMVQDSIEAEDTMAQLDGMVEANQEHHEIPSVSSEETLTVTAVSPTDETSNFDMNGHGAVETPVAEAPQDFASSEHGTSRTYASANINFHPGHILSSLSEDQLLDLRVTVTELKEDRINLLSELNELKAMIEILKRESLNLRTEVDEKNIELSIAKKRHAIEFEETKSMLDKYKHGLELSEAKNKAMKEEMAEIGTRLKIDHTSIRAREQELESQLELMAIDSDNKIKARDEKILELKRKIDTLEFNMENTTINERQAKKERMLAQQKLERLITNLRGSLNVVADTLELDDELGLDD